MALAEDLGLAGDITTNATIRRATASADIATRRDGVVAGLQLAEAAFRALDPSITVRIAKSDGARIAAGDVIATITGNARAILTAERVALNYMDRMSGIATLTRRYVDAVRWNARQDRRHPQDDARTARLREIRGPLRRWPEPPHASCSTPC